LRGSREEKGQEGSKCNMELIHEYSAVDYVQSCDIGYFVYIPCLLRYLGKRESAFQIDEVIGR